MCAASLASVSVNLGEKLNNCVTEWLRGFNEVMDVRRIAEFLAYGRLSIMVSISDTTNTFPDDGASGE